MVILWVKYSFKRYVYPTAQSYPGPGWDRAPAEPSSPGRCSEPSAPTCDTPLWLSLLEKAYAKYYGTFGAIEGGFVDSALVDLTGGIGDRIRLNGKEAPAEIADGSLWRRLRALKAGGCLLGAGSTSGKDTPEGAAKNQGIVQVLATSAFSIFY